MKSCLIGEKFTRLDNYLSLLFSYLHFALLCVTAMRNKETQTSLYIVSSRFIVIINVSALLQTTQCKTLYYIATNVYVDFV